MAPRQFEHELVGWHKPRVSAARVALEEADRLYRKGRSPGECVPWTDNPNDDVPMEVAHRVRSKKCSTGRSSCGGTWTWRVELRKRAVAQAKRRHSAGVVRGDRGSTAADGLRGPDVHVHGGCAESRSCARYRVDSTQRV